MLRVLIGDDHAIVRRGLIEILMRQLEEQWNRIEKKAPSHV